MPVSTISIGDKSVIVVDCSNKGAAEAAEVADTLRKGSALVATKPEKSVYIITNVTNLAFNTELTNAFKEYASANTRFVKDSIIVGLSGLQQVIFSAIKALTKREFRLEGTMDAAVAYFKSV